jgi:small neutral amino acid transporter SnatA (MarC family)
MWKTLVTAFVTFFVIVDPVALVPLFVSLTHNSSVAMRRQMAVKATGIATGTPSLLRLAALHSSAPWGLRWLPSV